MFADVIRKANTEQEIYFLLTSYIEELNSVEKPHRMSEQVMSLPLSDAADVRRRFEQLIIELDGASKRLDDYSCMVIREAVHILGTALSRLDMLDGRRDPLQEISVSGLDAQAA